MKGLSFIKPDYKRWVALFFLFCWVVPFLGVTSFTILSTAQAFNGSEQTKVVAVDKTAAPIDPKVEMAAKEDKGQKQAAVNTPPPVAPTPRPSTGQGTTAGNSRVRDSIDLNLLARVIYAEARGEPLEGQVAVGAVLINRVANANFPDDLWSVVFKKGEFCTVRDGQVWLEPNATAYRAARLAKAGWDPTYGALYFYNPSKTTSKWIWSRKVTTRIGSHVFAV